MPKNILQDMVKVKNIKSKDYFNAIKPDHVKEKPVVPLRTITPSKRPTFEERIGEKEKPRYTMWVLASICALFLFFALSYYFSTASVVVNPKSVSFKLNQSISASTEKNGSDLTFDLVVLSGDESQNVNATSTKDISTSATGKVILYNSFSTAAQTLNIDTKLEGSNGKLYKTKSKIVIPGINKLGKPGSVSVGIYAAVPGTEYNSTPLDFKIVNFKSTTKYNKIYGRSDGAISGGFKGKVGDIKDEDKSKIQAVLKDTLQQKLLSKARSQIPPGFILFKDAVFLNLDSSVDGASGADANTVTLKVKGTLYGILLNEMDLTEKIAQANIKNYDESPIYIPNIGNINFSLINKNDIVFSSVKNISFNLTGDTKAVYKVDKDKLLLDLLDKPKKDFGKILLEYKNIESAKLSVSPVWRTSIPDKVNKIKILLTNP